MDLKKDFEEIKQSIDNENVNNNQAEQQANTKYNCNAFNNTF